MKQVKLNKEISDVAFDVVGDVAEDAHAEMQKPKFAKRVQSTTSHIENYFDFNDMLNALVACDKEPFSGSFEYHPVMGYVLTIHTRVIDK